MLSVSSRRTVSIEHSASAASTFTLSVPVSLMPCFPVPDLIMLEQLTPGPTPVEDPPTCCCEPRETTKEWLLRRLRLLRKQHWWLDEQIVLPTPIKKGAMSCHTLIMNFIFCRACRNWQILDSLLAGPISDLWRDGFGRLRCSWVWKCEATNGKRCTVSNWIHW